MLVPMLSLLLLADPVDWPAKVQQPFRDLPAVDLGLKPLLQTRDGKKITTKDEWEKARAALSVAWLQRLGAGPEKPDDLDIKVEKTERKRATPASWSRAAARGVIASVPGCSRPHS